MKFESLFKKNVTMYSFKILSIASYDFRPSFGQVMDSLPEELLIFQVQKRIESIFDTFDWSEAYSGQGILHRPKQVVVRWCDIWAIRRVRQNFPSSIFQISFNRLCNMWPSIIVMENQFLVSGRPFWPFFLQCSL